MRAPRLTRNLTLERRVMTPDGSGGFEVTWEALGTLPAEVDVRRGAERLVGGRTVPVLAAIVTVRAAPPSAAERPRPEQRFVDGSRIYVIQAVAERDESGLYLECWTEEGVER